MLRILAAILIIAWLLGFTVFHVTAAFIHVLLVLAVVFFLVHLFSGRSSAT